MDQFKNGQKLSRIFWDDDDFVEVGKLTEEFYFIDGEKKEDVCVGLEVLMENGQMTGVPWAVGKFESETTVKYNLALVAGVVYENPNQRH